MLAICKSDRENIAPTTRCNILRQYKKTKRDEREQIQTEHRLYKQTSSPKILVIQIFKYPKTIYIYIQHIKTVIYTQISKSNTLQPKKSKINAKFKKIR